MTDTSVERADPLGIEIAHGRGDDRSAELGGESSRELDLAAVARPGHDDAGTESDAQAGALLGRQGDLRGEFAQPADLALARDSSGDLYPAHAVLQRRRYVAGVVPQHPLQLCGAQPATEASPRVSLRSLDESPTQALVEVGAVLLVGLRP